MSQGGRHLDRQLASVTKFFHTLESVFFLEHLVLRHDGDSMLYSERNSEANRRQWCERFSGVRQLEMDHGLVGKPARSLRPDPDDEGESPTTTDTMLPELR